MSKKLLSITVKGIEKTWSFSFYFDPQYINEWRADGLDVVEIENVIPIWAQRLGLTKIWCRLQDIFNFKNPWRA